MPNNNVGDTISLDFIDRFKSKHFRNTKGYGIILKKEKVFNGSKIYAFVIFFFKCGKRRNFVTSAYEGSFLNSKIVLIEKITKYNGSH